MKKMRRIVPLVLCMAVLIPACGRTEEPATAVTEPVEVVLDSQQVVTGEQGEKTETSGEETGEAAAVEEGSTDTTDTAGSAEQTADTPTTEETTGDTSAPVEYETGDGVMGSFLLSSDRNLIDTTNEYGVFYRVVYKASIEGDELIACGSMDYRNSKDQDPITISSDLTHIFKVDENTVYQKQGEAELETLSKEDFADLLESRKDSGMYFEVEISDGVVTTALLSL